MITRIHTIPSISNTAPATNGSTAQVASAGSFSAVYNRMQELHTAAANRTASPFAAQTVETAPSYASVYAPGSGGVYAPRPVDLENPEATLQKLEELQKDIKEKGLSGFFNGMDDNECYAYLYERYADTFGANFMDSEWQYMSMTRTANESDLAKSSVKDAFHADLCCALVKSKDWVYRHDNSTGHILFNRMAEAFSDYFGYGNMTKQERYRAILSDYAASGDPSYASSFKMLWMLKKTGAMDMRTYLDAQSLLRSKMCAEYAALDMTVADMAKSRYANSFYGFDAAAYLLGMMDYIQHAKETSIVFNYDPQTIAFFEMLTADLKALGGVLGGV